MRHYIIFIFLIFASCWNKQPNIYLSKDYSFIENKEGAIIRNVDIKQYDSLGNFISSKNIYLSAESKGSRKIYLFQGNDGYFSNELNKLFLKKNYLYEVHIHILGFSDSLKFKAQ